MVGRSPVSVVSADFNSDGVPDVAVANYGSDDVSILLGLGGGSFRTEFRVPAGDGPLAMVTGIGAEPTPGLGVALVPTRASACLFAAA